MLLCFGDFNVLSSSRGFLAKCHVFKFHSVGRLGKTVFLTALHLFRTVYEQSECINWLTVHIYITPAESRKRNFSANFDTINAE
jgi:hypothetical protein